MVVQGTGSKNSASVLTLTLTSPRRLLGWARFYPLAAHAKPYTSTLCCASFFKLAKLFGKMLNDLVLFWLMYNFQVCNLLGVECPEGAGPWATLVQI